MSTEHSAGDEEPLVAPRDDSGMAAEGEPAGSGELESRAVDPQVESAPGPGRGLEPAAEAPPPLYEERPPAAAPAAGSAPAHAESANMLPNRERRRSKLERLVVRLIATCGIVGIGVAIAAIMVSSHSQGWIVGLVVSIVSVILAALLWSSRML